MDRRLPGHECIIFLTVKEHFTSTSKISLNSLRNFQTLWGDNVKCSWVKTLFCCESGCRREQFAQRDSEVFSSGVIKNSSVAGAAGANCSLSDQLQQNQHSLEEKWSLVPWNQCTNKNINPNSPSPSDTTVETDSLSALASCWIISPLQGFYLRDKLFA